MYQGGDDDDDDMPEYGNNDKDDEFQRMTDTQPQSRKGSSKQSKNTQGPRMSFGDSPQRNDFAGSFNDRDP